MHCFSGLYKKMCEKAVEIQKLWREKIQTWDEYCEKGDHEDGNGRTINLGGMTEEEIEKLFQNNVWLPLEYQIREKSFSITVRFRRDDGEDLANDLIQYTTLKDEIKKLIKQVSTIHKGIVNAQPTGDVLES